MDLSKSDQKGGNNNSPYTLNQYQVDAMSFRMGTGNGDYALFMLPGEVGEICSLKAKSIRDGRPFDYDQRMKKELGDALWGIAAIAADHGFTLEDIAISNYIKLVDRQSRGVISGSGDNR